MNGVIVVNKSKNVTSRDVVNSISKTLNIKKVGHTGTLDPIATGVLVICIGKATKLVDLLTSNDKTYVATVKLSVLTDTLDITGNVVEERKCIIKKEELEDVLKSFEGRYNQEVPIYSAVKINGKKLYEYARENREVELPKRMVEIKNIRLIDLDDNEYSFEVTVSKGTYIRSLIKDINEKLGVIGVMKDLTRTKQGVFDINDSYTIDDVKNDNYKLITIEELLKDEYTYDVSEELYNDIKDGKILDNVYNHDRIVFKHNNKVVAIYKIYNKDTSKIKPDKMFLQ